MRKERERRSGWSLIYAALTVIVFAAAMIIFRSNSYADTEWWEEYEHSLDDEANPKTITLTQWNNPDNRTAVDIRIPATATIGGVTYKTCIESYGSSFFPTQEDNGCIKSFSVENGVVLLDGGGLFLNQNNLQSVDLSGLVTDWNVDTGSMFSGCKNLKSINFTGFNTANVEAMDYMFCECESLTELDLSGFDTRKVTEMDCMFSGCKNLTSLDISSFNTSKVENMTAMFLGCEKLRAIDVSGFDTSKNTRVDSMFSNCSSLKTLDLSNFDTSKVTDMSCMFDGCSSLERLDLSNFDTSKVEYMLKMFNGCTNLKELNVSSFNTSKTHQMGSMFYNCESLTELDLGNFSFQEVGWLKNGVYKWSSRVYDHTKYFIDGCNSLKKFVVPSNLGTVGKIELPVKMYLKKDGIVEETGYTEITSIMLAGETLVVRKNATTHTGTDTTVKYNAAAIDVSKLFTLTEGAGAASYSIVEGGTGSGTISGSSLTVTKAGTFTVKVTTAETDNMDSGEATAVLTVEKADGKGEVKVNDIAYGETPSPVATSSTNPGTPKFFYKKSGDPDSAYSAQVPKDPGKYTVKAVFPETDLYVCTSIGEFTISGSNDDNGNSGNGSGENGNSENGSGENGNSENGSGENGNGGENKTNPYEEYGLSDKYVPDGYEDKSGSPMIISGKDCAWNNANSKSYWYENGIKQGTYYDPHGVLGEDPETHEATIRGREIYDRESDGWYWLDSCYDGAKAVGKEVWVPYIYQDEKDWDEEKMREIAYESDEGMGELVFNFMKEKKGKWVRYDENGRMLKGWITIKDELAVLYPDQAGNTYYYDNRTGLMAKGWVKLDGKDYFFDETTGALVP